MKHSIKETVQEFFEKINSRSLDLSDLRKTLELDENSEVKETLKK
jgi:hypothetical protein